MKAPQLGAVKTILDKVPALVAVAFFGAIIAGLAFISVKIILAQHGNLTLYRDVGYTVDDQTIYRASGTLVAGLIGVVLSLWMAIRLFYAWNGWRTAGGSLWSLIVERYYPFFAPIFALTWILFLVFIAVGAYHSVITEIIPDHIAGSGAYVGDGSLGVVLGDFVFVVFLLLIGTGALVWAVYLALRLVANAVKFFLRQDGVIK